MHLYDNTPHPSTTQKVIEPVVAIGVIGLILFAIHMIFTYGMPIGLQLWDAFPKFWQ